MRPSAILALFLVAFAVFLIVRLPLAPFLTGSLADGFGVANSSGTVWAGRVEGLTYRGRVLGNATLSLRPLALLTGQAVFDVRIHDGPLEGHLRFTSSGNDGFGLGPGRIRAQIQLLMPVLPGLSVAEISIGEILMAPAGCLHSNARVTVPDLALEASLSCRNGQFSLHFDTIAEPVLVALGPVRTLLAREEGGYRLELGLPNEGTGS
ncbi:MAG: hypothetical protein Tsb008_00770 [Rhodothalassiaceae bacterium]